MDQEKEFYRSLPPVDYSLADAVATDVIYKLFIHPEQEVGTILTEENVASTNLDKTIPTVLLIHGWTSNDNSPWYRPLRDSFFRLGPHNVIYVDWSIAGNKSYDVSSANTNPIGKYMAKFLLASGIPLENIHVIGHSLGSQTSAFIGKYILEFSGKKLGRITALDPAGPKFEHPLVPPDLRLCKNDAELVDVIHTDIQLYGFTAPIGHVDFYPNEGKHQIGCPRRDKASEEEVNCSHARSTHYFIESLLTKSKAWEAVYEEKDYEVTVRVKEESREVTFGHHVEKSARGVYYFETNAAHPFLKVEQNILDRTA
ncbi:lipoprotein lipase-like [Anoplophora glabripennis]|uniref:lipoprotein lipase-like n=1 Tax=Anoplophora glabripennis TaxID=217634 RepID=UPI000873F37E|nr:lipoprotein lipase-like [Anoplophora glabripennis]